MDTNEMLELSQEFAALGNELHGDGDNAAALHRMVELAVKHVDGCSWASITVLRGKQAHTLAASDPVAARADALQYELNEGPCVQAAEDDADYLLFDVANEPRWPRFAAAVAEQTPVRSVLSFQLLAEESAALNLFADEPAAFGDEAINTATIFAAHASSLVALHDAEGHAANLESALHSNREIGVALGVLMAHHKVRQDEAFSLLRTASQNLHVKLRDVAAEVVETGALPDLP
ncbi:GAF and ANTAR domain-containing protein [Jatrophihabitans sp. DSM 45814]